MTSSSDIRKLFKALSDDSELHAKLRVIKTPAEKHEILRNAGLTPVSDKDLRAELAKCLHPSGAVATPEDEEFVDNVLHLAASHTTDFA